MRDLESLVEVLHADPESLPGVPADEDFRDSTGKSVVEQLGRPLSAGERQGFLEMWQRTTAIRTVIAEGIPSLELSQIERKANDELATGEVPEARAWDLRLLRRYLLAEQTNRFYSPLLSRRRFVWVGYRQPLAEQSELGDPNRWNIPKGVWEDKSEGASVRRAEWILSNRPDATIEELTDIMGLHEDEVYQLKGGKSNG